MAKETELAWAAGFIEGEGHVAISQGYHKNRTSHNPISRLAVEVSNTDIRGLWRLQNLFGGSVVERKYKTKRAKIFRWILTSKQAIKCLKAIRHYCCFKSDQIDIAIAFQKTVTWRGSNIVLTAEMILYRNQLIEQLRKLTRVGIDKIIGYEPLPKRPTSQLRLEV